MLSPCYPVNNFLQTFSYPLQLIDILVISECYPRAIFVLLAIPDCSVSAVLDCRWAGWPPVPGRSAPERSL